MPELSTEDTQIYDRLLDVIVGVTNLEKHKLNMNSDIDKLGIVGMDADELIEEVAKEFDIDFSDFEFARYCSPECFFDYRRGDRDPLLIEDLFKAAQNKRWTDKEPRKLESYTHSPLLEWLYLSAILAVGYTVFRLIFK